MGTTYHIKVITWYFKNLDDLKIQIKERLEKINVSMSTYMPDSEISKFNSMRETDKNFYVSDDFLYVAQVGKKIYTITKGAWDGTVMPLVELWGFTNLGSDIYEMRTDIPDDKIIRKILTGIGFEKIEISEQGYLKKQDASVSIDFGSIAKGYAVDQVANLIRSMSFNNFLVEIGGEVYASGCRLDGRNWRVGVNTPQKDSPNNMVYEIVNITNKALATSGDYRNFFEVNGKYYSHILD
ncbi:MAG: FAD:protein FMN transferase, partial [Desulfobacterales bacterium]|nr:FAD:protein FMN transferase [Desulfobacterales bacterium]